MKIQFSFAKDILLKIILYIRTDSLQEITWMPLLHYDFNYSMQWGCNLV